MAERDPRQECGCPPWVECVHFDEQILWLHDSDNPDLKRATDDGSHYNESGTRYSVGNGTAVHPCGCSSGHPVLNGEAIFQGFGTLGAAEQELDRRAELLRLGTAHA